MIQNLHDNTTSANLTKKYEHYEKQGHLILSVTLSTYIKSAMYAASDRMRHFWDQHFIRRVQKRLPKQLVFDHDWIVEKSPDGYFHFHGFIAVIREYAFRLWNDNHLNKRLTRDLYSFRSAGKYRPFRLNSFLIEPVNSVVAWSTYITKENINEA